MKCPVKTTVTFDKVEQKLKIRDCNLEHCHRVGKDVISEALSFNEKAVGATRKRCMMYHVKFEAK